MNAKKIFDNPLDTYIYLERYVNSGSPSGHTERQRTSFNTNPFTGQQEFELLEFEDMDCETLRIGKEKLFSLGVNYAHPDSVDSEILKKSGRKLVKFGIKVSPTASSRTLLIRNGEKGGFLKLTYDKSKIGGSFRYLGYKACLASVEVSETIKEYLERKKLPNTLAVLLETSAKVTKLNQGDSVFEWGTIYRELKPYPKLDEETQIIPAFSLLSKDINNPNDEYLINQFIKLSGQKPEEYLWNIIKIIMDAHWNLLIKCTLRPEMHCQNCMFELGKDYRISRIIIKDMEDVDKDLYLSRYFGYNYEWKSYPHKCFEKGAREYKYRSSFMYDFKLGEYMLTPLIKVVSEKYGLSIVDIENRTKKYVRNKYLKLLPNNYFPTNGCWYYCKDTESKPGRERDFFSDPHPKYR